MFFALEELEGQNKFMKWNILEREGFYWEGSELFNLSSFKSSVTFPVPLWRLQ